MGVKIELTAEQEAAVLASYGYDDIVREDTPDTPEAVVQAFDKLYGIPFGTPHNGKNGDLKLRTADGLVTWKFYVDGALAALGGVSDHGGDFHISTVADEMAKWDGGGYENILAKIEDTGLAPSDYAVFPENIGQVTLYGVPFEGDEWKLEMWQENKLQYTLTGPVYTPQDLVKFTLYQSGSILGVQYQWK